jgi:hypothetical protein
MLESEPDAPRAGYIALAIVEALIDVLMEQNVIIPKDRNRIITMAVEKLQKAGGSVRESSAVVLRDWAAQNQKLK